MPFGDAQSLTVDQTYAITAYLLHLNNLLGEEASIDRDALIAFRMPNAAGFVPDPRPDAAGSLCMSSCVPSVEIHSEARKIGVTPEHPRAGDRIIGPSP
jgi:cytochrome c